MKKKVGIVTINDYSNYGNRLQNYALQEFLKTFNCEVNTITNIPEKKDLNVKIANMKLAFSKLNKELYYKIKKKRILKENKELLASKINNFKRFTNTFIDEKDFRELTKDNLNDYSYFITGSDQVWNPYFRKGNANDFLTFAPKEKRLSYAPSFGVSKIPKYYEKLYKKWLLGFEDISVRESSGKDLIKFIADKNSTVLLDPTLMLEKNEWKKIFNNKIISNSEKIILTYFLGDIPLKAKKQLNDLCEHENFKIINIASFEDKENYDLDPAEFLQLIESSSLFLTDSFHGVVFSIIFDTPFIVFNREDSSPAMNSRIDNLLSKLLLENRKFESVKNDEVFNSDYNQAKKIIEKEKQLSIKYLKERMK